MRKRCEPLLAEYFRRERALLLADPGPMSESERRHVEVLHGALREQTYERLHAIAPKPLARAIADQLYHGGDGRLALRRAPAARPRTVSREKLRQATGKRP